MNKKIIGILICLLFIGTSFSSIHFVEHVKADDLTTGLVGYWSFDEGSGSIAHDDTGNGNDGTIYGASWTNSSVLNGALDFDGLDDYVVIPDDETLDITGDLTISLWVNLREIENEFQIIFSKRYYSDNLAPYQGCIDNRVNGDYGTYNKQILFTMGNGSDGSDLPPFVNSTSSLVTNLWYNIVFLVEDNDMEIFLNCNSVGSDIFTGDRQEDDSHLFFGVYPKLNAPSYEGNGGYFNGLMDEIRIYNRALNENEIQTLYSMGNPLNQGLVGYWNFDEGNGTIAHDSSGNGNDGTIYGSNWV
ncbi:MAG: LamG domain-containing protein, partial [Candidatus Thermoplasmatota archaeon]|nr:LamG domain-containing protein [Candidatus Thermoplasmatota archaeon]